MNILVCFGCLFEIIGLIMGFIFILLFILFIFILILQIKSKRFSNKNDQYLSHKTHSAIILANNCFSLKDRIYLDGVDLLIRYLKLKKEPYKIYKEVTGNKFKNIVMGKNIKAIYLFGHGQKHGIKFGKDDCVYYCELRNAPKKEFIAQLHCNHNMGFSLADYISKESYVVDGKRRFYHNRWHFYKKLRELKKKNK